ncbi:MAG: FAD-binding oxidoreductase [bacterium]|nr:FAD-binding oxidoreductase [bacterium]
MKLNMYDVIIIGGGIIGCAAAYYLIRADDTLSIVVVEKDPTYSLASTTLSLANVRIQFSLRENILISRYAADVLKTFDDVMAVEGVKPGIHYRREGNLFLVKKDRGKIAAAEKALSLQKDLGCGVDWWPPEKIKKEFPLYEFTEAGGLEGGTFGPDDGHVDAHSLLMGYKNKARALGVTFINGEALEITADAKTVTGVILSENKKLTVGVVINCAGAWAAQIARTVGTELPVHPVKRQVYVLDTAVKPGKPLPLTVLPSGLYFRSDTGGVILLGKSMAEDAVGFDFNWDRERFMDHLWPELAAFVPSFDRLRLVRGWAGLYAVNTFDGNAILGEWPDCKGFYLANGFSGHGLQQAPAVGRYLSELILEQKPALDLSIFKPDRILENKPLSETGLV